MQERADGGHQRRPIGVCPSGQRDFPPAAAAATESSPARINVQSKVPQGKVAPRQLQSSVRHCSTHAAMTCLPCCAVPATQTGAAHPRVSAVELARTFYWFISVCAVLFAMQVKQRMCDRRTPQAAGRLRRRAARCLSTACTERRQQPAAQHHASWRRHQQLHRASCRPSPAVAPLLLVAPRHDVVPGGQPALLPL